MHKIGVIGCGMIWKVSHSGAVLKDLSNRLKVVAVCDVSREAAEAAAKETGARPATDWREIVEDPEIDIVVSCTPPHVRAEHAVAAAQNGQSLLLEKPLARSVEDARSTEKAIADRWVSCVESLFRADKSLPQRLMREKRADCPQVNFCHSLL